MATFCDMASTWDANNKKTSESITGGMSSYAFNCAETTYDDEDLCFSSSLALQPQSCSSTSMPTGQRT
jgi:hypothetical protein